jgi:hypothetical protein
VSVLDWISEHPVLTIILLVIVGNTIIHVIRAWRGNE